MYKTSIKIGLTVSIQAYVRQAAARRTAEVACRHHATGRNSLLLSHRSRPSAGQRGGVCAVRVPSVSAACLRQPVPAERSQCWAACVFFSSARFSTRLFSTPVQIQRLTGNEP